MDRVREAGSSSGRSLEGVVGEGTVGCERPLDPVARHDVRVDRHDQEKAGTLPVTSTNMKVGVPGGAMGGSFGANLLSVLRET